MVQRDPNLPVMVDLVRGRVYKLTCRNLALGVWDGEGGFVGIRTKFGSRFLDTEYHFDFDRYYGTVRAVEDTGIDVPVDDLRTHLGTEDERTGRPLKFDRPVADGGRGWVFTDTDEPCGADVHPVAVGNEPLFKFLDQI